MAKTKTDMRGTVQRCSVCGEPGHKALSHKAKPTEKKCTTCGGTFPIGDMTPNRRPGRFKSEYPTSTCKWCTVKNGRERYTGSIKGKLTGLICAVRAKCRNNNIEFGITIDDLLAIFESQDGKCWYSGQQLSCERGPMGASIERKDPCKGYTKENVVLSTWRINNMKSNLTDKEFIDMCRLVADRR